MDQLVDRHTAWRLALTLHREGADALPESWGEGRSLPLAWHVVYCQESPARSAMAADGLPAQDPSLPEHPVYEQRLFGGATVEWLRAPRMGETLRCEVVPGEFSEKQGRSGPLAVYSFERHYWAGEELCVRETSQVVYRPTPVEGGAVLGGALAAVGDSVAIETGWLSLGAVQVDEIDVFRFSALMFNSHRVHYDLAFAREVDGHPGVLVQAKLLLLLALEQASRQGWAVPSRLRYRAHRTVAAPAELEVQAEFEAPAGGETQAKLETPTEGETHAEFETPTEGATHADSEVQAEGVRLLGAVERLRGNEQQIGSERQAGETSGGQLRALRVMQGEHPCFSIEFWN